MTASAIWSDYTASLLGAPPSLPSLRAHLQNRGLVNQTGVGTPIRNEFVDSIALGRNDSGELALGTSEVESVRVHRVDLPRSTQLVITTETLERRGYQDASSHVTDAVTEVFSLEPAPWDGLDFALLANNIDCIMCHTEVDDVRRFYGGDGLDPAGAASRAKVGSIERLKLRDNPRSSIAGTLYLGGPAVNRDGSPITDWSSRSLTGGTFDHEGALQTGPFGDPILAHLDPSRPDEPHQNLYTNYLDGREQVDGPMPDTFPLPFRDDGGFDVESGEATTGGAGNRRVDDNEFAATTASFTGTISGGAIGVVELGDRVTSSGGARDLVGGNQASLESVTSGNVVLTGTPGEPIRITGDVAIEGDLIISGPIEGTGSLWVKGNVYVRGDVTYNDIQSGSGDRQFGLNSEGTLNAFGLTAGGNIVMGDPFREKWSRGGTVDGTPSGKWNFTMMQIVSFNQAEWLKTQPELPGEARQVQTGTRTMREELFRIVGGVEAPYDPPQYREWEEPIMEWETPMFANPKYRGDDYIPRYYAFSEGDPVPIHNKGGHFDPSSGEWIAREHVSGWNMSELTLAQPGDATDPILYPDGRPTPAVETLMPRSDWMSDDVLRGLIQDSLRDRDPSEPFSFDGTLYSANSIFGLVPNRANEGTTGTFRVQGSILAADVGLLAPKGTQVLYDPRSQAVLNITDDQRITLRLAGAVPTLRL